MDALVSASSLAHAKPSGHRLLLQLRGQWTVTNTVACPSRNGMSDDTNPLSNYHNFQAAAGGTLSILQTH